ncbi:hypothetical protein MTO96_042900 [Rhipicephalus appendiculatus]
MNDNLMQKRVRSELRKLCQLESLGRKAVDDPFCHDEKVFKASNETTEYRDQRYEVCLPCKDLPSDLQDNSAVAVKQLRYAGKENPADLVSRGTSISSCLQAGRDLYKEHREFGNCTLFLPRRMVCCDVKQDFGTSCTMKAPNTRSGFPVITSLLNSSQQACTGGFFKREWQQPSQNSKSASG